ncbi:hypothetical protein AAVH_05621 [Aphelenchoides avenae]|nr:hypothetical protein AAVH_05621 [Aphelenchus avenae]
MLALDDVSLKLSVSLADFIGSFSSLNSLGLGASSWFDAIGLDDTMLDLLASNGILNVSSENKRDWNCHRLSEDALLSFAFGDSCATDRLRCLRGYKCQLSETFILKLVQARRERQGNHPLYLDLELDMKLVATGLQLSIDGLWEHGLYDDGWGAWRFTFADIPNFRVEYDNIMERVRCWSNLPD